MDELLTHREWILSSMRGPALGLRGLREQSFCRAAWADYFNPSTVPSGARFLSVEHLDSTGVAVSELVERISLALAVVLKDYIAETQPDGYEPRCAEGWQFSHDPDRVGRDFHVDSKHLGRFILTVTLEGDCTIEVEDVLSPTPRSAVWRVSQEQYEYYAIWGRSREEKFKARHRVVAGGCPRLSLTLRYGNTLLPCLKAHASNTA